MNLQRLLDYDRWKLCQLEALVAQFNSGGMIEDWQLDRLVPTDTRDAALARLHFRQMIGAEAAARLAAKAAPKRLPQPQPSPQKSPRKRRTKAYDRF